VQTRGSAKRCRAICVLRLNATKTVLYLCYPKGREDGLSGGPFAWASSVDGKLRSKCLAKAGLLLLSTYIYIYTWEIHSSSGLESSTCVRGCIFKFLKFLKFSSWIQGDAVAFFWFVPRMELFLHSENFPQKGTLRVTHHLQVGFRV
jgi:hypothetical protein